MVIPRLMLGGSVVGITGCIFWGCKQQYRKLENENENISQKLNELRLKHNKLVNEHKKLVGETSNRSPSYLHSSAFRNIGCGNCPYTNPTFGSIGPDQAFICPSNRPWYVGASWYLVRDTVPFINNDKDKQALDSFFDNMQKIRNIIKDYYKNNENIELTLKDNKGYHLTYQYLNCQTDENIAKIFRNKQDIFESDE
eukprot:7385_1